MGQIKIKRNCVTRERERWEITANEKHKIVSTLRTILPKRTQGKEKKESERGTGTDRKKENEKITMQRSTIHMVHELVCFYNGHKHKNTAYLAFKFL